MAATATLAAYNDALKRIYTQDFLEEQLYNENPFLDKIEKTKRFRVGETARVPLHVSRNGGYTTLPAGGGNLNAAGNQGISKAEYNYTNHHQQIAIQGDAIDGTADNSLSVANVLDTEVKGALSDMRRQLTRQLFGSGDGRIATTKTSTSNSVDLETVTGTNAIERGWLFPGAKVNIGTSGDPDSIASSTITSVDEANLRFTLDSGNVTTETGSTYVTYQGSLSANGASCYEMNGLGNLVSDTAVYGGLDPANQPLWKAANRDDTSQALSLSLLLQQVQKVQQKSGDEPDFMLTGLKQSRKFYELLQQQIRYASDASLSVGAQNTVPKWHGMEIHRHPDCQNEVAYFGIFKHLFLVAIDKPYWQNKVTGAQILSWIQGTDSYGAKLSYRVQLGTNRRNVFARLGGLS
jgi:hypothetical protein